MAGSGGQESMRDGTGVRWWGMGLGEWEGQVP